MAREKLTAPAANVIYTPHEMEWQRLSGIKIGEQTEAKNQAVRDQLNATVVLKKHHTEIYTASQVYQLTIGSPAQAVGGMGDTLAGMVGALPLNLAASRKRQSSRLFMPTVLSPIRLRKVSTLSCPTKSAAPFQVS